MYKEISFKWKWNPGHSFQHFVSLLFLNLSRDLFCTEVGVFAYIQLQNHASINIPGSFPAAPTPCHREQTGNSAKLRLLKKHVLYKYKLNDWIISSLEWVLKGPGFIRLSLSLSQNSQTQFSIMCLICENPIKHIFIQKLKNKLQKLKKYLTWPDWLIGLVRHLGRQQLICHAEIKTQMVHCCCIWLVSCLVILSIGESDNIEVDVSKLQTVVTYQKYLPNKMWELNGNFHFFQARRGK